MLTHPERIKEELVAWIRDYFEQNGPACSAVVGISGGKDSSVVAALCKEALGAERVVGVLMPNDVQSDIDDAKEVVAHLGIPYMIVNIGNVYRALTESIVQGEGFSNVTGRTDLARDAEINTPPRLRMATLYAVGQNCHMVHVLLIHVMALKTMWATLPSLAMQQVTLVHWRISWLKRCVKLDAFWIFRVI